MCMATTAARTSTTSSPPSPSPPRPRAQISSTGGSPTTPAPSPHSSQTLPETEEHCEFVLVFARREGRCSRSTWCSSFLFVGRYVLYVNTLTGRFVAWVSSWDVTFVGPAIFNVECRCPQHATEWAVPFASMPTILRALRAWMDA
ncbi:hypothetical protein C8R44DRAFT_387123 [Mycena epipterygia]|nr:hypothetical protein C8R44DRAFT_387123 [Mycena epipterygia]